ncbi:bleomycin hydrolase [Salix suchowensis]|nr:bleomycin hydrolase [Salix suchowensis]
MGSAPSKPTDFVEPSLDEKHFTQSLASLNLASAPVSKDGTLSLGNVSSWESTVAADPKAQLARTILSHSDIRSALVSRSARIADAHVFNTELDFKTGPVTNQKSSGRCWLFATTNVVRYDIMKKLNLSDFQFSQLNKCNYYLELSIENADRPLDDRLVNHLSGDLISDGGQWDMVVNLLENYDQVEGARVDPALSGISTSAEAHSEQTIQTLLRVKKEELMKEIYRIMSATLGVPPRPDEKFVWEYYNADGKPGRWEGSALEYYKTFSNKTYPPSSSFSLINDPRNEYSKLYTVDKLDVNTEIKTMKDTVVKLIKAGLPVFFGCDVGKFSDSGMGIMDTDLFEYENAFDITLGLTKAERLQVNESAMTHAMVISGVHLDASGVPVRYKVENSWSETSGNKGYFMMTDKWFEQFVYQVVVPKALAPKDLVKVYEDGNAIVLPPWDPMVSRMYFGRLVANATGAVGSTCINNYLRPYNLYSVSLCVSILSTF